MDTRVTFLLEQARQGDERSSNTALMQVAMLLERGAPGACQPDFYASVLPAELHSVVIPPQDRGPIIEILERMILDGHQQVAAIAAIWSEGSLEAFLTLSRLIVAAKLDRAAEIECLRAFERLLPIRLDGSLDPKIQPKLRPVLTRLGVLVNEPDEIISELAEKLRLALAASIDEGTSDM
jgi:hypothetical protein